MLAGFYRTGLISNRARYGCELSGDTLSMDSAKVIASSLIANAPSCEDDVQVNTILLVA